MYDVFFKSLTEKVAFTEEEMNTIRDYLTPKKLRKKQYLLQEGDVCKYIAFVEKGVLRSYSVDQKGSEHIVQFALEGWTIADLYSFLTGEPSTYNIDAIENCELVLISRAAQEELIHKIPRYETYVRLIITNAYISLQKRINSVISLPIEERYLNFIRQYPDIIQRVPQHMIAAFMGLTPETLSRVRSKLKEKG